MIVCICRGVRCSTIRAAIRAGALTVEEVGDACEAGTDCGSCQDEIAGMIDEAGASRASAPSPARVRLSLAPQVSG
ncbi:MAG: (2Fe-2S)-binding protein [Deltaproteobacteria bacterium]|nr:(2Fe-2S)-binding protein [Deltaproteobacteria bacterium]